MLHGVERGGNSVLVHLGQGVSVHDENVLILTDLTRPVAPETALLLDALRRRGQVRQLGPQPKTLVLCRQGSLRRGKTIGYLSCVGLRTLRQRMDQQRSLVSARNGLQISEVQHG